MTGMLRWVGALAAVACGGPNLGSRVTYDVYEDPHPYAGGEAGSCMPMRRMSLPELQRFRWAVGTKLEVHANWPDRTDCTGNVFARSCPTVQVGLTSVGSWSSTVRGAAAEFVVSTRAVADGEGGFTLAGAEGTFAPPFLLEAMRPSAIWFEKSNGHFYGDVIPGAVTELVLSAGSDAAVAVTLRDANGAQLCGPVFATVSQDGVPFTYERVTELDYVNLPYHIIAGPSAGRGSLRFRVGQLEATLGIVITQ